MAKNYVEDGKTMDWTNSTGADVVSGDPVVVGSLIGVAHGDIANGDGGVLHMTGVIALAKDEADTWSAGDKLYFDDTSGNVTATEGDIIAGTAWADAENGDTDAPVRLGY
jgi:predicted RecA/RadA family phage recombinase